MKLYPTKPIPLVANDIWYAIADAHGVVAMFKYEPDAIAWRDRSNVTDWRVIEVNVHG